MSFSFQKNAEEFKVLLLVKNIPDSIYKLPLKNVQLFNVHDEYNARNIDAIIVFHSHELRSINLSEFKNLKLIKVITAGINHIPIEIRKKYLVLGTHGPNAKYIAEHALALTLACARRLVFHTTKLKLGEFHQTNYFHISLFRSSVLIMGFGPIGRYTAGLFRRTFNTEITVFKKTHTLPHLYSKMIKNLITDTETLMSLLPSFDVVINTLPLTEETEGMVSHRFLSSLKKQVIIVNVSRGKVISEKALFHFLKNNPDACAGIDVWYKYPKDNEPFAQNFPFNELDNIVMTPHNAPVVKGYFYNMLKSAIYQVKWDLKKTKEGH